ncbi:putative cobalt transporter CbtA [Paraburkholderia terricola]|uniref:CbtA family protein n=1 Tax=Paraburkholderia terricola TaxID=169427 RepID=UPI002866EAA0|nr:CbtA family protein [Paraburkholderia terricola]MDR6449606.1 putative cobalt transporter CbtA [Paraburkholderia terricola]
MVGKLLMRGMLAGVVAGLIAFAFARVVGEPQVERAIAFEKHAHAQGDAPELELVSRETQAGLGLLTGVVAYGAAIGGLFAVTFACAWGRVGKLGARPLSAWLALAAFVAFMLVPNLKYPANPPSIGDPDTIGYRTGLFFLTIAISVAIMVLSLNVRAVAARRLGEWNGALAGLLAFVMMLAVVLAVLPDIDEVPAAFPATLLWRFRVAAIGVQAVIWTTIGALFGVLAERSELLGKRSRHTARGASPATRAF